MKKNTINKEYLNFKALLLNKKSYKLEQPNIIKYKKIICNQDERMMYAKKGMNNNQI